MCKQNIATRGSHAPWKGTTGAQFEEEIVITDRVKIAWDGKYHEYLPSMNEIVAHQIPNSALTEVGLKFRDAIARQMNVNKEEINVFVSVNTCLDKIHGIDMFVVYQGKTVTVDITKNSQKRSSHKADVIVTPMDLENDFFLAADHTAWAFRMLSRPSIRA